jgi:hypothetical protein
VQLNGRRPVQQQQAAAAGLLISSTGGPAAAHVQSICCVYVPNNQTVFVCFWCCGGVKVVMRLQA